MHACVIKRWTGQRTARLRRLLGEQNTMIGCACETDCYHCFMPWFSFSCEECFNSHDHTLGWIEREFKHAHASHMIQPVQSRQTQNLSQQQEHWMWKTE